jgi:hypothetical protein
VLNELKAALGAFGERLSILGVEVTDLPHQTQAQDKLIGVNHPNWSDLTLASVRKLRRAQESQSDKTRNQTMKRSAPAHLHAYISSLVSAQVIFAPQIS